MRSWLPAVIILGLMINVARGGDAELKQVAPLLDEHAMAVLQLDLPTLTSTDLQRIVPQSPDNDPERLATMVRFAESVRSRLVELGARQIYVPLSTRNLEPSWLIPLESSEAALKVARYLATGSPDGMADPEAATRGLPRRVAVRKQVVFCGTQYAFEKLTHGAPIHADRLQAALNSTPGNPIVLAMAPSPAQQRILAEFWPAFPAEAGPLTGQVAGSIEWLALGIHATDDTATLQGSAASPEIAATFLKQLPPLLAWIDRTANGGPGALPFAGDFAAEINDKRFTAREKLSQSTIKSCVDRLARGAFFAAEYSDAVRGLVQQGQYPFSELSSMKQFGLAMHNFHDEWGAFPPAASYSADGKPLLSWRVHLLPYLDQNELYKRFKLDEPWDSPHNKLLIQEMPVLFGSGALVPNVEGKTVFVLPTGEKTLFSGPAGTPIQEIKDGTSNTILVLQVGAEQAVIWTKPDDLPVDFGKLDRLFPASLKTFRITMCDGSVLSNLNPRMKGDVLRRLLQPNDGEPINFEEVR